MSNMQQTPAGERVHIAFFGKRNAGKSSVVNAFTGQNLAIVSDVKGTTTDPVQKAMELAPLGPVLIIDTPGMDDEGTLGEMRVSKTLQVLNKTDLAIVVIDATQPADPIDAALIRQIEQKNIPYIVVKNKADLLDEIPQDGALYVSALTGLNIHALKERAAAKANTAPPSPPIVGDLLEVGDTVVLVTPIDKAAPKGRLILPQQLTIRDILDAGGLPLVCRDTELPTLLAALKQPPRLVITDSQVFGKVSKLVPPDVQLTSFSILMARYKGDLSRAVNGAQTIDTLQPHDRVLIAEGCTHHRQCEDIGTVKIPNWIRQRLGFDPDYTFVSGTEFPADVTPYKLVIHCGGCTLNEREMQHRLNSCTAQGVPVTNYGILIAHLNGILERTIAPFSM